ncbi:MAG TPA: hypothetical protein VN026_04815 [Bacteroidia bacterium]|jgi:hypothetical protein|nr:hypothetical protein [Bacteroidia bacterium]
MKRGIILIFNFLVFLSDAQNFPLQKDFEWPDKFVNYKKVPDSLNTEDAIILKEVVTYGNDFISRRIAIKIQNNEGLAKFKKIQLPENYDLTNYPNENKLGRFKGRKDPFIYSYAPKYFAARIIKPNRKIIDLQINVASSKVYWVVTGGERIYDFLYNIDIENLEAGDILEYTYKADVDWRGGIINYYPNESNVKFDYNLTAIAYSTPKFNTIDFIDGHNSQVNSVKTNSAYSNGNLITTKEVHFDYLKAITYSSNIRPGINLPHLSINYGIYYMQTPRPVHYTGFNHNVQASKPFYVLNPNVWLIFSDSSKYSPTNNNYNTNLRKFLSSFDYSYTSDSTGVKYMTRVTDSLNTMKYVSSEDIHYSGNAQYSMASTELLNKGKITEEFVVKNYFDILNAKNIFYYQGIVMDKRQSEIRMEYRGHMNLEKKIIILPDGKSFKYFMPRYKGMDYNTDELPFYFEGVNCALIPAETKYGNGKYKTKKVQILFTKTPKSLYNENTRSEAGVFKIKTDSFSINVNTKLNLGGQFSTVLRHYYNNSIIDSTIGLNYYKKCTDKPHAKDMKITMANSSKIFPFKCSYNTTEKIGLASKNSIDLNNWFSFTCSEEQLAKKPNHDYYVDFQYTDAYNYLFEFDKAVELLNADDFSKKMNNDYFEINSNLVKQDDTKYLLSVMIKVKQDMIPEKDAMRIMDFVAMLDVINHFKLNYKTL